MSDILNINWKDVVKGLVVAVFTSILTAVYQMIERQDEISFKQLATIGSLSMIAYLIKQLGTDTDNKFLGKI